jgi:hypothetical protein
MDGCPRGTLRHSRVGKPRVNRESRSHLAEGRLARVRVIGNVHESFAHPRRVGREEGSDRETVHFGEEIERWVRGLGETFERPDCPGVVEEVGG